MTLASSLQDFSLAELFRMIEQGRKSGRLSLFTEGTDTAETGFHVWFCQGRVVAAADCLDGQGLSSKIVGRGWLSQRVIERLDGLAPKGTPLGLTLKTQGALQADQLNLLFISQMQQIWSLFERNMGRFDLDGKASLPSSEMTGLSLPAMEVALAGLRALKNWTALKDALPNTDSAVQSIIASKPQIRLNAMEWQVWEFAKGTVSINSIAKQLNQPVAKVQQAAFRLMLAGLVEEIPLLSDLAKLSHLPMHLDEIGTEVEASKATGIKQPSLGQANVGQANVEQASPGQPKVSNSLLQNLVGFLRSKA